MDYIESEESKAIIDAWWPPNRAQIWKAHESQAAFSRDMLQMQDELIERWMPEMDEVTQQRAINTRIQIQQRLMEMQ